jgi:hypothetical protein
MVVESPRRPRPQPRPDSRAAEPSDALIEEARRWQRRRRLRFCLLGLAAAAVAGGVAWMFSGSSPRPLTVGEIAAREAAALKSSDRLVVRMSAKTSRGYSVAWADFAKLQTRTISDLPPQPRNQEVVRYFVSGHFVAGDATIGSVSYASRTSATYDVSHLPIDGSGVSTAYIVSHIPRSSLSVTIPEALLNSIHIGHAGALAVLGPLASFPGNGRPWVYRRVGKDEINGQPAVELQTRMPKSELASIPSQGPGSRIRQTWADTRYDVWINEASYLPVREQTYRGTRLVSTVDLAWLPDTKANLALLNLQVPRGFTHSLEQCNDKYTSPGCSWGLGG